MMLRLVIGLLRWVLGALVFTVVTLILGRGRWARRVLGSLRLLRRIVRL